MQFIIGDVHGEISKLRLLIKQILEIDRAPTFVFIGDYLDKGEDVLATLEYLEQFREQYNCTFLIGNHEFIWLNLEIDYEKKESYLINYGATMTMASLGVKDLREAKRILMTRFETFFSSLVPYWKNDTYLAVHSGIKPNDYNTAVEDISLKDILFNRYDFLQYEKLYMGKHKVVFGHTGFFSPFVNDYKIGVDTSACFTKSQPLTAFCLDEDFFIDSNNKLTQIKDILPNVCPNIVRVKPWRYDK